MSGWPDPNKPGVPLHPERDGWHWVTAADPAISTRRTPWFWDHKKVGWMPPVDVIGFPCVSAGCVNWIYLGPCLTPAEADALKTENARLREALRDLLPHAWAAEYHSDWIGSGVRREACREAEAALAGEVEP